MIEGRPGPGGCVVALLARLGEPAGDVIGVGGAVVVSKVTLDASTVREAVIVVGMALSASQRGMETSQGPIGRRSRVIEGGAEPVCRAVAGVTGGG